MIHLIVGAVITVGTVYFVTNMVVLAARLAWLAILIAAWLAVAVWTALLLVVLAVQKASQVISEWRWKRRYGEILPPLPPPE
jgi:hypothetical protein